MTQSTTTQPTGRSNDWRALYRISANTAFVMVLLIPLQIFVFVKWPPPADAAAFFSLFQSNWLLGLLGMDLLYLVNNALLVLVYLGLYVALERANRSLSLVALVLGLVGIAAYYASGAAFEMLTLSRQHAAAATAELKSQYLAAGHATLARYQGTAFDAYYVLNAVALLLFARVMLRDRTFSRATAVWGLVAGFLMVVPSTAGTLGLAFSLASLIPWIVFSLLVAKRLFQLSARPAGS